MNDQTIQPTLFSAAGIALPEITLPEYAPGLSWNEKAVIFDRQNPTLLTYFVGLARRQKAAGRSRGSINQYFEIARYEHSILITGHEEYRLNNNFRAWYAREIMRRHPDLAGFFQTRQQTTGSNEQPA